MATPQDKRTEQTTDLVAELREDHTDAEVEDLQRQLVEVNMPVADAVASRYRGKGIAEEDLRQVAYLALVKAAQRFDPEKYSEFLAYAVPTVRGEVRKYFRDKGWMVRPPRRVQELQANLRPLLATDTNPSDVDAEKIRQVAKQLDVTTSDVIEALSANGCFNPTSLDTPMTGSGSGSRSGDQPENTLIDTLATTVDGQDYDLVEARVTLSPALADLNERDQQILFWRFWEGMTQQDIAKEIGVTQMQVSRLIKRILTQLHRALEHDESGKTVG